MTGPRHLLRITASLAVLFSADVTQATTLRALSTRELVQESSAIGVARVIALQAIRNGGRITTIATLEVLDSLKGLRTGERILVRTPGGVIGEQVQRVEGAPVMNDGDLSVVFLEPAGATAYRVVGMEQGKLDVVRDSTDASQWVVRRSSTALLMAPSPDGILGPAEPPPATEPLDAYLDQVRSLVESHP